MAPSAQDVQTSERLSRGSRINGCRPAIAALVAPPSEPLVVPIFCWEPNLYAFTNIYLRHRAPTSGIEESTIDSWRSVSKAEIGHALPKTSEKFLPHM